MTRSDGWNMLALTHFNQNFGIVENLLQLHSLASGLRRARRQNRSSSDRSEWTEYATNEQISLWTHPTTRVPPWLLDPGGMDFLLRQAVISACTSLESFLWDVLAENAALVVRTRRKKADPELRKLVITFGDYLELERAQDREAWLRALLLKNFERGILSDVGTIERVARLLTVQDIWSEIARVAGVEAEMLRRMMGELVARRNLIAHRADRPETDTPTDAHGLRPISYAWTHARVHAARTLVTAADEIFSQAAAVLAEGLTRQDRRSQRRGLRTATGTR